AEAENLLEHAHGWADQAGDQELKQQLVQAGADLELARDLDRLRQGAATRVGGKRSPHLWDRQYPEGAGRHRVDAVGRGLDGLAEIIRTSAVRVNIVAALDDWALAESDDPTIGRLLRLANRADDPDPWRQGVREALARKDDARLIQLAKEAERGKPTPGVMR